MRHVDELDGLHRPALCDLQDGCERGQLPPLAVVQVLALAFLGQASENTGSQTTTETPFSRRAWLASYGSSRTLSGSKPSCSGWRGRLTNDASGTPPPIQGHSNVTSVYQKKAEK
jgi:hypothetical protein